MDGKRTSSLHTWSLMLRNDYDNNSDIRDKGGSQSLSGRSRLGLHKFAVWWLEIISESRGRWSTKSISYHSWHSRKVIRVRHAAFQQYEWKEHKHTVSGGFSWNKTSLRSSYFLLFAVSNPDPDPQLLMGLSSNGFIYSQLFSGASETPALPPLLFIIESESYLDWIPLHKRTNVALLFCNNPPGLSGPKHAYIDKLCKFNCWETVPAQLIKPVLDTWCMRMTMVKRACHLLPLIGRILGTLRMSL